MSKKKKRQEPLRNLHVESYAAEGKSIARLEGGKVIFMESVIPGDVVDAYVTKDKKNWAEARVINLIAPSADRIAPFCSHFGLCGGCKWQMMPYHLQLKYKRQQVADQLSRISGVEMPEVSAIIGSATDRYYRNKLEFTFSTRRFMTTEEIERRDEKITGEPALGFHAPGLFDKVVAITHCYLQPDPSNHILNVLKQYTAERSMPYYDYKVQYGWLRNVVIRVCTTGETLVNLVLHHDDAEARIGILEHLKKEVPGITSLNYTINPKLNDSIHDLEVHVYAGKPYIEERLEDFRFKISPKSFFQTNTRQAEQLYRVARDYAGLTGNEVVYDLYCGTGSIGIFCSAGAKKIVGVEVVEEAVNDARENAAMNGLNNCSYHTGDVDKICTDAFFALHGRPDVVITDPPRAGMTEKMVQQLLRIAAPKIVYVSCNPATQARDLQWLNTDYIVTRLQPVDMFPQTHHIENVALLERRTP